MFRAKNNISVLYILLHVSVIFIFSACDENEIKSQDYINHNETLISFRHIDIKRDSKKRADNGSYGFKKSVIKSENLKDVKSKKYISLNTWWLYAIVVSLIVVLYFIVRLVKKQKNILEKFDNIG